MKRKEVAKKLGITVLAFMLALPCALPAVCSADILPISDEAPEEDSDGLNITMKEYKKEFKTSEGRIYKEISFEYPAAEGTSDAAQAFNKFYTNLLSKWKKSAKENLKDAEEIVLNLEDTSRYYTDEVTCEITNKDENYISVLQSGYTYEMGAHGMPYRYTYIFDARTGKKISAAQLLGMTKNQLNKKVRSLYLKKFDQTQASGDYMFYPNREEVKKTLDGMNFNQNLYYLKNGKVRFYADPYAVGPYAAGFIEAAVKL